MSEDLKYGWRKGGKVSVPVPTVGSETHKAQSGHFVYLDSGVATLCADGVTEILGSIEVSEGTTYTAGDILNCIVDPSAIFRIPVNSGTFAADHIGKTCDISISSNIQGAQVETSAEDTLYIVGGDLVDNNYVDVMINTIKQRAIGTS